MKDKLGEMRGVRSIRQLGGRDVLDALNLEAGDAAVLADCNPSLAAKFDQE